MYEMTSARVPFDADNFMGILTKHMYEEPVTPHELPPPVDVPPALEAVILKCLAKKAELRYQTMQEVLADLELVEQGLTPTAVVEGVRARPTRQRNDARDDAARVATPAHHGRRRQLRAAQEQEHGPDHRRRAMVALLLVGGAIFAFVRRRASTPEAQAEAGRRPCPCPRPATRSPRRRPPSPPSQSRRPRPKPKPSHRRAEAGGAREDHQQARGRRGATTRARCSATRRSSSSARARRAGLDLTLKLSGYKDAPVRVTAYTQEKLAVALDKKRGVVVQHAAEHDSHAVAPKPAERPSQKSRVVRAHARRPKCSTPGTEPPRRQRVLHAAASTERAPRLRAGEASRFQRCRVGPSD